MKLSLLLGIAASAGLCTAQALAQQVPATTTTRGITHPLSAPESAVLAPLTGAPISSSAQPAPLVLRNGAVHTGLFGFYDYQSNGTLRGRIYVSKSDPNKIHTSYMLSLQGEDSATVSSSRRVGYAVSNDGGQNWQSTREIETGLRLGFPVIDVTPEGIPYLAVHGDPDGSGVRTMIYRGGSSGTSFTRAVALQRESFTGRTGEDGAGVIWPGFVIDPKDPTKQVVVATLSTPEGETDEPVHFIHNALGTSSEWDIISIENISTSSGGRNILATSQSGKVGLAYYHGDQEGTSGVYFSESTDGGGTWSTPVRAIANPTFVNEEDGLNGDQDSIFAGFNLDLVYNGDEPMIVASGSLNGLYSEEGLYMWNPSKGFRQIFKADSTKGIGLIRARAVNAQPNMNYISYPGLSIGDDGQHMVVTFQAGAQTTSDDGAGDAFASEFGFYYFRVWAIGSADGGQTWNEPRLLQDFVGEGDTASIEYPAPAAYGKMNGNTFQHQMVFHARKQPGMYAFVVADVSNDEGDQPASRGPLNDETGTFYETYQYFQRTQLDPTFFGQPASVGGGYDLLAKMSVKSFPNPASGSAIVEYEVPTSGDLSLKIYDVLGAEVLAPVSEKGFAGTYKQAIDLSSLPNGQYRMVLSQNGRSVSQPLNIVR